MEYFVSHKKRTVCVEKDVFVKYIEIFKRKNVDVSSVNLCETIKTVNLRFSQHFFRADELDGP